MLPFHMHMPSPKPSLLSSISAIIQPPSVCCFPRSSQCLANSSNTSVASSMVFSFLHFSLGRLLFLFRCPPFRSDQNSLQLGPPCSFIFFSVLFLISFFSFLISFFTSRLLFLYVFHFSSKISSCFTILLASLSFLHASFLAWIAIAGPPSF